MKSIITGVAFSILTLLNLNGQNRIADEYRIKMDAFRAMHPPAMVFFHLDKSVYEPGDTIHYKAYQIESEEWKPRPNAQFFDVKIIETSKNMEIQHEKIIVDNGTGLGAFKLNDDIKPGNYKFSADSHLMNFDAPDIDFICYFKVNRLKPEVENEHKIIAECFVEGGQMVQGILSRIIVKANEDIIGMLVNAKGDSLAAVPITYGFSSIKYRPKTTEKLFVKLGKQLFPLPEVKQYGTVMTIDNQQNDANLAIIFSAKLPPGIGEKRMLLMTDHDGKTGLYFDIVAQNGKTIQMFPKAALRHGINRFLIIDSSLNILNERLLYHHNPALFYLKANVKKISENNTDVIDLEITAEDKDGKPVDADLSISITDSIHHEFSQLNANIVESFSIQQYLAIPLSNIGILFDKNRISDQGRLDMQILSSSYGRYKWADVRKYEYKPLEPFRIPYADERKETKKKDFRQGNGLYYWNPSVNLENGKGHATFKVPKGVTLHYNIVGFDKKGLLGQLEF